MKKLILVLTVALFLIGLSACGGGKYADVKSLMNKMIDANEKFAAAADKAKDVDDAIAAIDDYADDLKGAMTKLPELMKKYPELNDPGKMPAEFKALNERGEEAAKKMHAAMTKLTGAYSQDPKFQAAMMKIAGSMVGK